MSDAQIKAAYEVNGMLPDEIADDLGYEVPAIKAKLMQISSAYRKACGVEPVDEDRLNFSEDQLLAVNRVIFELAIGAEDEHLRGKMATYVRDDKKGRKEIVKNVGNNTFNIVTFNESIQQARLRADSAKKQLERKPIEV